jgi:hypothetical protein
LRPEVVADLIQRHQPRRRARPTAWQADGCARHDQQRHARIVNLQFSI